MSNGERCTRFVYVAGPYTKGDVAVNVREAVRAAEELVALGYEPFIPHLTHFWHCIFPHEVEFWYERDIHWLKKCDAILRLPGESRGADEEMRVAKEHGIPARVSDIAGLGAAMEYHEQVKGRP